MQVITFQTGLTLNARNFPMVNRDFKQLSQFWTRHIHTILHVVHFIVVPELEEAVLQQWNQCIGYNIVHIVLKIQKVPGVRVKVEIFFFLLYSLLLMWYSSFWIRQSRSICCFIGNIWAASVQWTASSHWLITFSHPFRQKTHWTTRKSVFFFLCPVTWIGSTGTRLGVSWSKAGEVGRGFGKGRSGKHGFCCCQQALSAHHQLSNTTEICLGDSAG